MIEMHSFQPGHAEEVVSLWRASFEYAVGIVDPHTPEEQREYLLSTVVPNHTVRVPNLDDKIVGFIAASSESINQLYVGVEYHRKGIGSLLIDWAKRRSGGSLWLYTFQRNKIARTFYERHGFSIVEEGFEETWQLPDLKYSWSRLA